MYQKKSISRYICISADTCLCNASYELLVILTSCYSLPRLELLHYLLNKGQVNTDNNQLEASTDLMYVQGGSMAL